MIRETLRRVVVLLSCLVAAASAQAGPSIGAAPVVYRLGGDSTFLQGCFEPCDCPLMEASMRGTYCLRLADVNPVFSTYEVSEVNFFVGDGDPPLHISGGGKFTIGGEVAYLQRMELDLVVGDQPAQHFDSGWTPVTEPLPAIVITVSVNNMYCYDTVLNIASKPVPKKEIKAYKLQEDSTYQQGCFTICDCLLEESLPMEGGFGLVLLQNLGTYREYAVVKVAWKAAATFGNSHKLSGAGRYISIDGFAGPMDQMELWLSVDGADLKRFDSGLNNSSVSFPEIDVTMTMNNYVCYDIELHVHAKPAN